MRAKSVLHVSQSPGLKSQQDPRFFPAVDLRISVLFFAEYNLVYTLYYISITIVQSHTGKYHEFVAVCIVTSA